MKNKDWWKFWKVGSTPLKPHGYAGISIKGHKGISEPVFAIVKSFGEKGRWKVKPDFDVLEDNMFRTVPPLPCAIQKLAKALSYTVETICIAFLTVSFYSSLVRWVATTYHRG